MWRSQEREQWTEPGEAMLWMMVLYQEPALLLFFWMVLFGTAVCFLSFFFFFFLKAWIKRSPGSSPDIWLSSWVSEVNWTPFLSYEIVMPKHKSYPDRNLNCSKTGTIRMSFIWFLIIVKCWTKDKILCFSKKSFVPLHKINMRSLICIQVFLETILK